MRRSDSPATGPLILESPRTRSTNSMGTSTTRRPGAHGAVGQVGLEDVAGALHGGEVDLLQRLAPEEPEAGRRVLDADPRSSRT